MRSKIIEQRGCFFCRAPRVRQINVQGRILYECLICKKKLPRFHELTGRTKVQQTKRGPMHFSAGALIERDGKYLIMKRATWPFLYATIGGHVDKGEAMQKALAREVKEETGLTIQDKKLLFKGIIEPDPCSRGAERHFWNLYLVHIKGRLKKDSNESLHLRWFTKRQLARLKFTPPVHYIFKKLKFFSKRK